MILCEPGPAVHSLRRSAEALGSARQLDVPQLEPPLLPHSATAVTTMPHA